jgi:hypothetical protein
MRWQIAVGQRHLSACNPSACGPGTAVGGCSLLQRLLQQSRRGPMTRPRRDMACCSSCCSSCCLLQHRLLRLFRPRARRQPRRPPIQTVRCRHALCGWKVRKERHKRRRHGCLKEREWERGRGRGRGGEGERGRGSEGVRERETGRLGKRRRTPAPWFVLRFRATPATAPTGAARCLRRNRV